MSGQLNLAFFFLSGIIHGWTPGQSLELTADCTIEHNTSNTARVVVDCGTQAGIHVPVCICFSIAWSRAVRTRQVVMLNRFPSEIELLLQQKSSFKELWVFFFFNNQTKIPVECPSRQAIKYPWISFPLIPAGCWEYLARCELNLAQR